MFSSTKLFWIGIVIVLITNVFQAFGVVLMPLNFVGLALTFVSIPLNIWQKYKNDRELDQRFEHEENKRIMYSGRLSYEPIFAEHRAMHNYEREKGRG
jgi:hypothetical protein